MNTIDYDNIARLNLKTWNKTNGDSCISMVVVDSLGIRTEITFSPPEAKAIRMDWGE